MAEKVIRFYSIMKDWQNYDAELAQTLDEFKIVCQKVKLEYESHVFVMDDTLFDETDRREHDCTVILITQKLDRAIWSDV